MRKIVVTEFISLDGVVEDPGGSENTRHGGWSFRFDDPVGMKYKLDETLSHEAMLLGRVTYDGFAQAWPSVKDDVGFADKMNSMPKYVVSKTLTDPTWNNTTVLSGDLVEEVTKLKAGEGGDLLVAGSVSLVQGLAAHDLVDEYRLMTFPIVLGGGKRLFGASDDATVLKLVSAQPLASGTVILTYHPASRP